MGRMLNTTLVCQHSGICQRSIIPYKSIDQRHYSVVAEQRGPRPLWNSESRAVFNSNHNFRLIIMIMQRSFLLFINWFMLFHCEYLCSFSVTSPIYVLFFFFLVCSLSEKGYRVGPEAWRNRKALVSGRYQQKTIGSFVCKSSHSRGISMKGGIGASVLRTLIAVII